MIVNIHEYTPQLPNLTLGSVSCFATQNKNSSTFLYLVSSSDCDTICYLTKIHPDGYVRTYTYGRDLLLKDVIEDFVNEEVCAVEDEISLDITIDK